MPLILVTGISTSGKSTVAAELTMRGFEAYDTEHNGISAWYDKKTGDKAADFGKMPERTEKWLDEHEWLMSLGRIHELSRQAQDKLIFLCGGSANEDAVRHMCHKVIWLKTDEETIRKRVLNARDHDYGTKPHELYAAIKANETKEAEYQDYGATIVDATQPIGEVVDDIVTAAVLTET